MFSILLLKMFSVLEKPFFFKSSVMPEKDFRSFVLIHLSLLSQRPV